MKTNRSGEPAEVLAGTAAATTDGAKLAAEMPDCAAPRWTFGLSTLFFWITLVAVVMGVARISPGLGVLVGAFSLPAALDSLRTGVRRRQQLGRPLTVGETLAAFFWSLGILVVGTMLLLAMLGAVGLVAAVVGDVNGATGRAGWARLLAIVGILIGSGVAILVLRFLARASQPR